MNAVLWVLRAEPQCWEPGAREVVTGKGGQGGVARLHPELTEDPMPEDPMPEDGMALAERMQKSGAGDFLRSVAEGRGKS